MNDTTRNRLHRGLKLLTLMGLLGLSYVAIDFFFDRASPPVHRFALPPLMFNAPLIVQQDRLLVLVARYDQQTLAELQPAGRLAKISQGFRQPRKRVDVNGYFVALAYGTQGACPLEIRSEAFIETCSGAEYDRLGQSQEPARYPDLTIPKYNFNHDYSVLTIE